ncbi:UDP-N-acetylmuramoylalanine--D-glutamate ligase [Natranaerovirga pectinivora]|uniref:UDP-N-acetylmuramoylalanine--D-glutamate ligase n=1 Tax=Natranaerovirga pectinivora TaxID=682400 RepID=A0A4R3MU96_9FIRM|nr:UDP-N-acetylmuramoyl-L-alanine--D-glutamate ligase [Natranaerovirga pectinivora]TCT16856.1 UDP-N-acetylmuramoylalanine--D-glutamate ligase [Natranaerovirga pectinivora]
MNLVDKNVLVIGLARSGISAIKLLHRIGANVLAYDGKEKENFENQIVDLMDKAAFHFGDFDYTILDETDLVVISPGVPTDLPFVTMARQKGISIWSELELAYKFYEGKLIAITGTNGKTTTTTLVGDIMKAFFEDVYVVGNIGLPFSEVVLETNKDTVVVAEVSSFQLETIEQFRPDISAILNITPDHLNRHKTMENYIESKKRITLNQTKEDVTILNYDDLHIRGVRDSIPSKMFFFSKTFRLGEGVYLHDDFINIIVNGSVYTICHVTDLKVLGIHNVENVMAAVAISVHMGIPAPLISKAIKAFTGVEHRTEYVTTINDVNYYNDSKATNPDAAIKGIESMIRPTVLIAGGMDKKNEFDEWIKAFNGKVKHLILFGETKHIIDRTAKKYNFHNTIIVNDLEEAVGKAKSLAKQGDCVLLSPACASWDMFESYEARGNLFKEYVVRTRL